jgi:Tfp pilus assembly protein PilX
MGKKAEAALRKAAKNADKSSRKGKSSTTTQSSSSQSNPTTAPQADIAKAHGPQRPLFWVMVSLLIGISIQA